MNTKYLAPLLIVLTLAVTACDDNKKGADYTNMGPDGSTLPGDTLGLGRPENARGDFDPNQVNYDELKANTVYFAFDSSTIPRSEQGKLSAVQQWLAANPGHQLFLAGHADKRGTPEYNRALGERRALAVREFLVGLGIKPDDLFTNSYGADRPAVEGDTEDAYAKNRRVEVGVIVRK